MEKLPEDFKKKWVDALRGGEYKQGKNQLRFGDEYCCLGVGCIVAGIQPQSLKDYCYPAIVSMENPGRLPTLFNSAMTDSPAWILAHMNDQEGKSFLEIADYIEANL